MLWGNVVTEAANNSSPPGHNGRRFADDIFRRIFMNEFFLYYDENFMEICS